MSHIAVEEDTPTSYLHLNGYTSAPEPPIPFRDDDLQTSTQALFDEVDRLLGEGRRQKKKQGDVEVYKLFPHRMALGSMRGSTFTQVSRHLASPTNLRSWADHVARGTRLPQRA